MLTPAPERIVVNSTILKVDWTVCDLLSDYLAACCENSINLLIMYT